MTKSILRLKNGILLESSPEKLTFDAMISGHGRVDYFLLDTEHALYLLRFLVLSVLLTIVFDQISVENDCTFINCRAQSLFVGFSVEGHFGGRFLLR